MGNISTNFSRWEFACHCGCGFDTADVELVDILEQVRAHFGGAVIDITGPNRCRTHNEKEGGALTSRHLVGQAVDFKVAGIDPDDVADFLEERHPFCYGIGRYRNRTHLDVRSEKARWDKR